MTGRVRRILIAGIAGVLAAGVPAYAWFSAGSEPTSIAHVVSTSVGTVPAPIVERVGASSVRVTWSAAALGSGAGVTGYEVTRAASPSGAPAQVGSGCTGTIAVLTCTETDIPVGTWTWRVTPRSGTNWRGASSPASTPIAIGAPGLVIARQLYGLADFPTPTGPNVSASLTGFGSGESIQVRLGGPLGTILQATPMFAGSDGSAPLSITLPRPADGPYTLYVLGGAGSQATGSIEVDTTPATSTFSVAPATPNGSNGWYVTMPSFSLVASDGAFAGATPWYRRSGGNDTTWTAPVALADGTNAITYWSIDRAANRESERTSTIRVDTIAPTTTDSTAVIGSSWRNGAQTVNLFPTDASSGVATTRYTTDGSTPTAGSAAGTAVTLSSDGTWTVRYFSTDVAGNVEAPRTAGTIVRIDRTVPELPEMDMPGSFTSEAGVDWISADQLLTTVVADPLANGVASGIANVAYFSCSGTCTPVPGGPGTTSIGSATTGPYEVRTAPALATGTHSVVARATDAAGNASTSLATTVSVDAVAPSASLGAPAAGTLLRGTVTASATIADAESGVASARYEVRATGSTDWVAVGQSSGSPYSIGWNTQLLADGPYDLRVIATDNVGNTTTSATRSVTLDNTAPAGSITSPASGSYVRGTITITSSSADLNGGAVTATFQMKATAAPTWTTLATVASAPYQTTFNTTTVVDGTYDLRVVTTDTSGNATTSAIVQVIVDNTPPRGIDVQTTNRTGGTAGRPETNDRMTLTYSEPILPTSILAGWGGESTAIMVRFTNSGASGDTVQFWNAANTAQLPLGSVVMGSDVVNANTNFNATLLQSGNGFVITLGTVSGASGARTGGKSAMRWTPSALATDRAGNACQTTQVTETGTNDSDF